MSSKISSVVLWDNLNPPPNDGHVLLWKGYKEKNSQQSILKYLEKNSDLLRFEYLNYIFDIGQLQVQGKRIVEHLEIEPNFSLWWMSLLAEKSPLKSKAPLDCLRLLAVNHFLLNNNPHSLELVSGNKKLSIALKQLCATLDISFTWTKVGKNFSLLSLTELWNKLHPIIQAPLYLARYIILRWPLRKVQKYEWNTGGNSLFIVSYFDNLDKPSFNNNEFYSLYWGKLPNLIRNSGMRLNWMHHYVKSSLVSNSSTAITYTSALNKDTHHQGVHKFFDSFLTLAIIARTLVQWLILILRMSRLSHEKSIRKHLKGWLWPLLSRDWKNSIFGPVAIQNLLWVNLFSRAIKLLPKQNRSTPAFNISSNVSCKL